MRLWSEWWKVRDDDPAFTMNVLHENTEIVNIISPECLREEARRCLLADSVEVTCHFMHQVGI
jgi:hypothetical protein